MSGPGDDAFGRDESTDTSRVEGDGTRGPAPAGSATREPEDGATTDWAVVAHDVASSVLAVVLVGAYLFAVSGVWPPLVAIESGSMHPNMQENDLVFVMDNDRFAGDGAVGATGVVTARAGAETDYRTFGNYGDVIVFKPGGSDSRTPIIHRAMFWVEEGENWYDRANPAFVGAADSCAQLQHCPTDQAGFITKGDHNSGYDQAGRGANTGPVDPEWVVGTAEFRIPGLGWIRLRS